MATLDDDDLDDATLWAVIDSYSTVTTTSPAASAACKTTLTLKNPNLRHVALPSSSPPSHHNHKFPQTPLNGYPRVPDVDNRTNACHRPQKMARSSVSGVSHTSPADLMVVNRAPFSPVNRELSHNIPPQIESRPCQTQEQFTHCLSGRFPTVSLFKNYQDAAMEILENSDYTVISGSPFIKKSGWRKIAFYFNVSFEIKDKSIEFDENRNVQRAEFVVRAYMQGGRFSDGWGSCERREKKFLKPNNDIPSTAETRAKNRACQDLLGIGAYRPRISH